VRSAKPADATEGNETVYLASLMWLRFNVRRLTRGLGRLPAGQVPAWVWRGTQDTPERVTIFMDVKNRPSDGRFFTSMTCAPGFQARPEHNSAFP